MASQILTPFDVTGSASAATRQEAAVASARASRPAGPPLARALGWMLVSAATGFTVAAATAAWMVGHVHLF